MKRIILLILISIASIVFLSLTSSRDVYSTSGCDEDCTKCHKLTSQEASDVLKSLKITDAKIQNIQISPLKGLWEVSIEKEGEKGFLYVDFSKKYVVGGPIIEIKTAINKTEERLPASPVKIIPHSKIPLKDALIFGNKKAVKKVIVFTDTD
jgi:thiol:disulfide interchange protein DsbC